MAASFRTVWIAAICLLLLAISLVSGRTPLVPSMNSKRFFSKLHQYLTSEGISLKDNHDLFVHDGPLDNQVNDIGYLFPSDRHATRRVQLSHRSREMPSPPCLPREKQRQRQHSDAIRIGHISFPIVTRKEYGNWNRIVHAECMFLVGLSDFKQRALPNPHESLLSWYKLKTSCKLSSSINGMRDGQGEAGVLVGPLRMLVRMADTGESSSPEMQVSEAKGARVSIRDLEGFPIDLLKEVSEEMEKTILCIVNSDVRDVLMDSMKCQRVGSSVSCKLSDGYQH